MRQTRPRAGACCSPQASPMLCLTAGGAAPASRVDEAAGPQHPLSVYDALVTTGDDAPSRCSGSLARAEAQVRRHGDGSCFPSQAMSCRAQRGACGERPRAFSYGDLCITART
jgi:hypothetical protein